MFNCIHFQINCAECARCLSTLYQEGGVQAEQPSTCGEALGIDEVRKIGRWSELGLVRKSLIRSMTHGTLRNYSPPSDISDLSFYAFSLKKSDKERSCDSFYLTGVLNWNYDQKYL